MKAFQADMPLKKKKKKWFMLCKVMMLLSGSNTNILQIYLVHSVFHTSMLYDMYICLYLPSVHTISKNLN